MDKDMKNRLNIKNPIGISIDNLARSIYITMNNNKISRTVEKKNMIIDYDHNGKIVGVEIICLKSAEIKMAVKMSLSDIRTIVPALS